MPTAGVRRAVALIFALGCAVAGLFFGESYIGRLPHHQGYFLVPVPDEVHVPLSTRPRHTLFIVIDGLRRDAAEGMRVTQKLLEHGQCRVSDQGSWTVSRPVYALLSTGLEVERTGARNNEQTEPLAAESIWQVARAGGLHVSGSSHLPWFKELFPDGFDHYATGNSHADNVFQATPLVDVNVFHPLYVDEAGHHHGAASAEYAERVERADREMAGILEEVRENDLVVFVADHGHRAQGGHGGAQPEIKDVLLCFAGLHVAKRTDRAPFDGRSVAPALSLLLGLPFPRHMRAGDDGLDAIFEVASFGENDRAYVEDRRAAVTHFRDVNRAALEQFIGSAPGTWPRLHAREGEAQTRRGLMVLAAALIFLGLRLAGAKRRGERAVVSGAWVVFALFLTWVAHRVILGDLDFTVINLKIQFVPRAFAVVLLSALLAGAAHFVTLRRWDQLASDVLTLLGLVLIANLGHVFVYGWPLGFPLPGTAARYLPFFGAFVLVGYGLAAAVLVLVAWRRARYLGRVAT